MNPKLYTGKRLNPDQKTASDSEVRVEFKDGRPGYKLKHEVYHSPTGLSWGYGGSGPADLARSILADYLGETPNPALYQKFKWDFIAPIKTPEFVIDSTMISIWLEKRNRPSFHLSP